MGTSSSERSKSLVYALVFVSGVAALIYQVVWHKYLSILLGAQARATAVTLAIFLGGISLGYATFGRWSRTKRWNLLLAYCLVELGLAAWAICFPHLFNFIFGMTPTLYSRLGVESLWIDIGLSVVLLGLPTFLMGGTLPLLTQGLSENLVQASSTHARIYGFNTVGSCVGSLLAGYILIPATDLPVSVTIGGILNALVAGVTYFTFVKNGVGASKGSTVAVSLLGKTPRRTLMLFGVGFLSGFYVLTLETVLIRLVGLSTGSSNYNFTLIVSIFVFGLGIGSLLVRKIAQFSDGHLMWNQLIVAALLLLVYLGADSWPYWVHLVRVIFRDNTETFYFYQFTLGLFFLAMLIIPVGLAGFTLPLCFHLVKDKKETLGYRVGQLYAINTIGCVLGALFGGYYLLKFINLDQLFKVCIAAALLSSCLAAYNYATSVKSKLRFSTPAGVVFGIVAVGLLAAPNFARDIYTQPFRHQSPISDVTWEGKAKFVDYLADNTRYITFRDGPNTSVGLGVTPKEGAERSRTLFVNGKSDGNTSGDLLTMALTGHFPAFLAKKSDRVCVIGFGTGVTAGVLANYRGTREVHVAEIADTLVENAQFFDKYNGGASRHPKVKFHSMDAFRYLGASTEPFDVIVSEPSNPWVAGVENLYSQEFYSMVRNKLGEDGLFVQWVQSYSFNDELFKMVLRTMNSQFPYVRVFQMLDHDFALVATNHDFTAADMARFKEKFREELVARRHMESIGIQRLETLFAFEMMPPELVRTVAGDGPIHRLEAPRLSHLAAKAFYSGTAARVQNLRRKYKEFYPLVNRTLLSQYLDGAAPSPAVLSDFRQVFCGKHTTASTHLCRETLAAIFVKYPKLRNDPMVQTYIQPADSRSLASLSENPRIRSFTMADLLETQKLFEQFKAQYSAIDRLPVNTVLSRLDGCLKVIPRGDALYGDCLIQKAAVYEIIEPSSEALVQTVEQYSGWFNSFDREHPQFARFKRAWDIMTKLVQDQMSKS